MWLNLSHIFQCCCNKILGITSLKFDESSRMLEPLIISGYVSLSMNAQSDGESEKAGTSCNWLFISRPTRWFDCKLISYWLTFFVIMWCLKEYLMPSRYITSKTAIASRANLHNWLIKWRELLLSHCADGEIFHLISMQNAHHFEGEESANENITENYNSHSDYFSAVAVE